MPTEDHRVEMCRIELQLGRSERCPEEGCIFWEQGSEGRPGGCTFEGVDFAGRTDLALWLHDLREQLADASDEHKAFARQHFYERLNAGRGD